MNDLSIESAEVSEAVTRPAGGVSATGRRVLLLLAAMCILPVAASYFSYYVWPPSGRMNYGALILPTALPRASLAGAAGQPPLARAELEGRWTLVLAAPATCAEACRQALYRMRQARLAQGEEMGRVGRVWLLTDGAEPASDIFAAEPGLRLARAGGDWLARLPENVRGEQIFLVDPLGNVMMRFPAQADTLAATQGMIRDLRRLLKYSALGRGERE